MRTRPLLAASAALVLLGGPVIAAVGDPADGPSVGSATSTLTLLDLTLGGENLRVLELALGSDSTPATSFVVTPLTAGGTAYGKQTLTSRSAVLPVVDTRSLAPAALSALAAVRTPVIDVVSSGGTSSASASSLGDISVLGMPLTVNGTVRIGSTVDGAQAMGEKTLVITDLALPSIADLLAARGLDLTALPVDSLVDLLDGLDLTSTSITDLVAVLEAALAPVQSQVSAAEALVAGADDTVAAAAQELADAQAALAAATTTLNDATRALTGPTAGLRARGQLLGLPSPSSLLPLPAVEDVVEVLPSPSPLPVVSALPSLVPVPSLSPAPVVGDVLDAVTDPVTEVVDPFVPVVEELLVAPVLGALPPELAPLVDVYTAAKTAYDAVLADITEAQAVLDAALQLLDDARTALEALLAPYTAQIDAVVDAAVGVLDATPLVSLDRLEVTTRSTVTSAGQTAEVVGGQVAGLRVLGTDVLDTVLGSTQLDLPDLTSAVQTRLTTAITGLAGTLSAVLSQVPGLPGLSVPAPTVSLLSSATVTDVVDGYGIAGSALRALNVTWPGLAVPATAALPGAATLPAVTGLPVLGGALRVPSVGEVLSAPLSLGIATLEERARFRPGMQSLQPGTAAPGTGAPGAGAPGSGAPGDDSGTPGDLTPGDPTGSSSVPPVANPRSTPVGLTQLPRTGLGSSPLIALVLVGAALGLHRRRCTT